MGAEFIIDNLDDMCNLMCDNHYERGKKMTKDIIEDFRFIVIPYMVNRFKEINFEGQGGSDAEEFKSNFNEICDLAIKALEQEPTTKNDLGVDCIDRAELLKAMDTWDKFGYTARHGLERLDKDDKGFVPYVKYDDMVNCVKGMPSVTPIRPKGHWITETPRNKRHLGFRNGYCSVCKDFYTDDWDIMNYCPNCGADMREEKE